MRRWIPRHFDPDELLAILYAIVCVWRGCAAWSDLVGKPRDAPHLHLDPWLRAVLWVGCAVVGLIALRLPRSSKLRKWALSPVGMGGMFTFVLGSYFAAWITAWEPLDAIFADNLIKGDSHAWGSMPYYLLGVGWAFVIMLSPRDWTYLNRPTPRPGRLEKGGAREP